MSRLRRTRFRAETNDRLERLGTLTRKQRRDVAGALVVGKATVGTFVLEARAH